MEPYVSRYRRRLGALALVACVSACSLLSKSEEAPQTKHASALAPSDWPATPISAFRPPAGGICPEGYALMGSTCVHGALRSRISASELEKKLADYRAGASAPRVGGGPAPGAMPDSLAALDLDDPANLPPDAFTKKRKDAAGAKAARLKELETLIRNARIRAGEQVDPEPSALPAKAAEGEPWGAPGAAKKRDEDAKLSEMTAGLPPDVLKAVLVEIERNGGTEMVSLEELRALQAQANAAQPEDAPK